MARYAGKQLEQHIAEEIEDRFPIGTFGEMKSVQYREAAYDALYAFATAQGRHNRIVQAQVRIVTGCDGDWSGLQAVNLAVRSLIDTLGQYDRADLKKAVQEAWYGYRDHLQSGKFAA